MLTVLHLGGSRFDAAPHHACLVLQLLLVVLLLCRHLILELRNLPHQLLDDLGLALGVRVEVVDVRLSDDVLASVGKLQRVERLLGVDCSGVDGGDEGGEGVAAQAVLQQPGELRVAVGHVGRVSLGQCHHDSSQRAQALVDDHGLLGSQARVFDATPLVPCSASLQPLAARQVDHVQLPADRLSVSSAALRDDCERQDGVRARGVLVHQRLVRLPMSQPAAYHR
mmetsp:Transcript_1941/g.4335  ORF Transcript_1941/g.4335 Transcript_1941/m.4335 type:complete len:225 (-) Transcript_1941:606-1280(-)